MSHPMGSLIEVGPTTPTPPAGQCPHGSWMGDEGPIEELGRWPIRWRCTGCGAIKHDASAVKAQIDDLRGELASAEAFIDSARAAREAAETERDAACRDLAAASDEVARSHAALNDVGSALFCITDRVTAAALIAHVVTAWMTGKDAEAIHATMAEEHDWTDDEVERLERVAEASDAIRATEGGQP